MNGNENHEGAEAGRGVVSDAEVEHAEDQQEQPQMDPQQQPIQQAEPPFPPPPQGPFPGQLQQMPGFAPPAWLPPPPGGAPPPQQAPPSRSQHAMAMAFYEQRMRDHAAAYATAAAGAAWAAFQIAAQAKEFAASANAGDAGPPLPPPQFFDPNGMPPALPMPLAPAGFFQDPSAPSGCPAPPMMPIAGGGGEPNFFHPPGLDNGSPWQNQNNQRMPNNLWQNPNSNQQYTNDANYDNDAYENSTRNNRRKIQRRPPGGISIPRQDVDAGDQSQNVNSNNNNKNSRVRRRLRDQDSSNSSCATSITSYNSDQAMGSNNNNNHGRNYGNQQRRGGRGGNHYHRYKKRMKQPRDDTNLLGKTGICALYEWCGKRRLQPSFTMLSPVVGSNVSVEAGEDFLMAVYFEDGIEWGRGRGQSKNSAKQDAARKALQALVPGVVFDTESGFLVELPTSTPHAMGSQGSHHRGNNPGSLEDLAPVLAQRLSIETSVVQGRGRDDGKDEHKETADECSHPKQPMKGAAFSSKTLKRAWNVYPGTTTSTNSEEDDENAYYASRGASVCSVLLFALVQIDERIREAPQYVFEVSKMPTNAQMKRKGPASSYGNAIVIRRGPFTCTATLKLHSAQKPPAETKDDGTGAAEPPSETQDQSASCPQLAERRQTEVESRADKNDDEEESETNNDTKVQPKDRSEKEENEDPVTVLSAEGIGGTKRESKHNASAKLLALLFPECETMVEVKAAAEAAREAYAASKALKQQSQRNNTNGGGRRRPNRRDGRSKIPRLSLSSGISHLNATAADKDPPLPPELSKDLFALLGAQEAKKSSAFASFQEAKSRFKKLNLNQDSTPYRVDADTSSKVDIAISAETVTSDETQTSNCSAVQDARCRQHSRRTQVESQIDKALLVCNEEEERELTVEVGRTVLRRAEPDDADRIRRLLSCRDADRKSFENTGPASIFVGRSHDDEALRLWGSSTIVLLLCRSIAAFEDPPLGCVALTLGFSMTKGRLLRIAQMGIEPHLPRERFLDCLEAFASCMQCTLDREEPKQGPSARHICESGGRLTSEQCRAIVESHLQMHDKDSGGSEMDENANVSAPLQSVLEESEGGDDSDRPKEASSKKMKGQDKPCKRSRVV